MVEMCDPQEVRWCDGSAKEWKELCGLMVDQGSMIELDRMKRPNSYLVRSDPRDVAPGTKSFPPRAFKQDHVNLVLEHYVIKNII